MLLSSFFHLADRGTGSVENTSLTSDAQIQEFAPLRDWVDAPGSPRIDFDATLTKCPSGLFLPRGRRPLHGAAAPPAVPAGAGVVQAVQAGWRAQSA